MCHPISELECLKKVERFEVLEGAALRPKNMKKHVSGAPDTRPFAFFPKVGNLRSPSSNLPSPISNSFLEISNFSWPKLFEG